MPLDLRVHHWKKNKAGKITLSRSIPYLRLKEGAEMAIFIQNGCYYTDNGEEVKKIPPWVSEQLKGVPDAVKQEVGLGSDSKNKLS